MNYIPIHKIPEQKPASIIIRHAERFSIDNMVNALDIRLTEKGHNDSRLLGKELSKLGPATIHHSPVPRCQETALGIQDGILEAGGTVQFGGFLMEMGGPYVLGDWMELVEETRKHGSDPFVRKWFNGELMEGLMMPVKEAAFLTINVLVKQLREDKGSFINISHDWNIMILREFFFDIKHEEAGLPDYLDGMAAYIDNGRLRLLYHDREKDITLPLS
ncbi:MAG: hypothetical protein CVV44_08815 [Spirochaetae bacterium HGW-Spirochaetae-1]|jgi:hypothetical protein|nr:MAG: hypothetical protein CVV44_08815 [Spirochaetae bacterium HGW-Spirochaetae-1]